MLKVFCGIAFSSALFLLSSGQSYAHEIRSKDGTKCMDISGSGIWNGNDIVMYPCTGNNNQNFIYEGNQLKYAKDKSYCADVNPDDSRLTLWKCHGKKNQKFTISDGSIYSSYNTEQCLTVREPYAMLGLTINGKKPQNSSSQADNLVMTSCSRSSEQQFSIPKYCLYADANYQNKMSCGNDSTDFIQPNDQLSSISVVNAVVNLYQDGGLKGRMVRVDKNIDYLGDFNDRASSLSVANERTFLITSDPQVWCGVTNCGVDDATADKNISEQYSLFRTKYPDAEAVIINGDLTAFGHAKEWNQFWSLTKNLSSKDVTIPYYFGLGNHDFYNNYNDCAVNNCAIRSLDNLKSHVQAMSNLYSFDAMFSKGYEFPEIISKLKGSLSYSVNFGNILLIQLNDFESGRNPININEYVSGWEGLGAQRYQIERYQDAEYQWLHNQLYAARKKNQIVILNHHRPDADAGSLRYLINKFNVKLLFAGHYHDTLGKTGWGWYLSGSSARGTWLKLTINDKEKTAKIYSYDTGGKEKLVNSLSLNVNAVDLKPLSLPINVQVKNKGGYVSYVNVSYTDRYNVRQTVRSGNLAAGNTYNFSTPVGSKNVTVAGYNYTGLLWAPERWIFTLKDKNENVCVDTWGTTLDSKWAAVDCNS